MAQQPRWPSSPDGPDAPDKAGVACRAATWWVARLPQFCQSPRSGTCRSPQRASRPFLVSRFSSLSHARAARLPIYLPRYLSTCRRVSVPAASVCALVRTGSSTSWTGGDGHWTDCRPVVAPPLKRPILKRALIWLPRPAALSRFIQSIPARHPLHLICLPGDQFLFFRLRCNCIALMCIRQVHDGPQHTTAVQSRPRGSTTLAVRRVVVGRRMALNLRQLPRPR